MVLGQNALAQAGSRGTGDGSSGGGGSGTVTSVVSGTGIVAGTITSSGTITVDVGTTASKIVQLDSGAKLPAVDGNALTNLNAATKSLNNIASTSVSADLIGNTGAVWAVNTLDPATTVVSQNIAARSGNTDAANSGNATFRSGNVTTSGTSGIGNFLSGTGAGTASSGVVLVSSGAISGSGSTGTMTVSTGLSSSSTASNATGVLSVKSGAVSGASASANSGASTLSTGDVSGVSSSGASGQTNLNTGNVSGSGASGPISILTGTAAANVTGNLSARTGTSTSSSASGNATFGSGVNSSSGNSGSSTLTTGTVTSGSSGNVSVSSGTASGAGTSGNISLVIGGTSGGTRGKIKFVDGSDGTSGQYWVSSSTDGTGGWSTLVGDGNALTNINAVKLQTFDVATNTPTSAQVLQWNATTSTWRPQALSSGGTVTSVAVNQGTGLTGGTITGSGTIAIDVGVTTNKIIQVGAGNQLPAIDANLLSNINAVKLQSFDVATNTPTSAQVLTYNSTTSSWRPQTVAGGGTVTSVAVNQGTGLTGGTITGTGTIAIDVGVTTNKIIQVATGNKLPAIDANALTNVNAVKLQTFDVATNIPTSAQVLTYNTTVSAWRAEAASAGSGFAQGGNSFGATATLGTSDANNMSIITGGSNRIFITNSSGNVGIGTNTPNTNLDVNGFIEWQGQSRVTTDFSRTSSTALTAITGLSATLTSGKTYAFKLKIFANSLGSGGMQMDLGGGSATVTDIRGAAFIGPYTPTSLTTSGDEITALGTNVCNDNNGNEDYFCYIDGIITVNAGGTFIPRFAQSVSSGSASKVYRGSYMEINQIN